MRSERAGRGVLAAASVALALCGRASAQTRLAPLPDAEAKKLRDGLTEAFAGDEKAARALLSAAKGWGAKYELGSLVAALRDGPALPKGAPKPRGKGKAAERLEQFDTVTTGFTFEAGGDLYRYAVDLPPGYSPAKPAAVLLDPGHGVAAREDQRGKAGYLGFYRGRADAAGLDNVLVVRTEIVEQIGADGIKGKRPEDQVSAVFDALFADLASRFALDLDRVWVSGLSQTGFWSWQLGLTRPDRFAGIAPMGAVTWSTGKYLDNLTQLSIWIAHGERDNVCPVAQPRETAKALAALGARVLYKEVPGGAHDFSVWRHLGEGLAWLAERPRNPYPRSIGFKLQTLEQPWCYWVRVEALDKEGAGAAGQPPTASLSARIDGQEVELRSEGVEKLTLCLASELLDLAQPVRVTWNGKTAHDKLVERDFARTLEFALDKCDWRGTFEAALELRR